MSPTHLYVKRHRVTGLLYFGKTTNQDPHRYRGSGKRWRAHLKKHGNDVETWIIGTYGDDERDALVHHALRFSAEHDIVDSPLWANLIAEDGLAGRPFGSPGHEFSEEERARLSEGLRQRWAQPGFRESTAAAQSASWTPERRAAQAEHNRESWTKERAEAHLEYMRRRRAEGFVYFDFTTLERTPEHRAAISKALTGKPKTPEHRANLSAARKLMGPTKLPPGVKWLGDNRFEMHGEAILRVKKWRWEVEGVGHPTLTAAAAAISAKYLLKSKD